MREETRLLYATLFAIAFAIVLAKPHLWVRRRFRLVCRGGNLQGTSVSSANLGQLAALLFRVCVYILGVVVDFVVGIGKDDVLC